MRRRMRAVQSSARTCRSNSSSCHLQKRCRKQRERADGRGDRPTLLQQGAARCSSCQRPHPQHYQREGREKRGVGREHSKCDALQAFKRHPRCRTHAMLRTRLAVATDLLICVRNCGIAREQGNLQRRPSRSGRVCTWGRSSRARVSSIGFVRNIYIERDRRPTSF